MNFHVLFCSAFDPYTNAFHARRPLHHLLQVMYDCLVQRRQHTIMEQATRSNAIVSSLFPSNVRDRLMEEIQTAQGKKGNAWTDKNSSMNNGTGKDKGARGCASSETIFGSQPIAELFPESTIM